MAVPVAYAFTKEDMKVDQSLGFPKSYAKLCKDTNLSPYINGPPLSFTPYTLSPQEGLRAKELDEIFPIIDPQANPTAKATVFVSLLWKQLNHLGNAGFDPAMFRVDPYGNVVYFHADPSSPLAWDIDHWFPCSRGGLTVPSNLRILQCQVCKTKNNQLEFLVPWWDLQLGISVNQFLSMFASSDSDFRKRAFRLLFIGGENEELHGVQIVDSRNFPQPFMESKEQLGLAPAAVVRTRRESFDGCSSSTLRSLDFNRQPRPTTPMIAATKKFKKENEVNDMDTNPYQAIVMARDSLKQREETKKMKAEIQRLDNEVNELRVKNEEEKFTIQELELELIKRRRRAEKCHRLAETQSSYRSMLEKMIRNAMHQSVTYREQVRQNQAATQALLARLEAQMAICNSAEKLLHKRYKQRDDLEKRVRPEWEDQGRKRSRTEDDTDSRKLTPRLHKELRDFLYEEHKLSQEARLLIEEGEEVEEPLNLTLWPDDTNIRFPIAQEAEVEEDEDSRKERGKGNVEKWLQMLVGDVDSGGDDLPETSKRNEIVAMFNEKYPQDEMKVSKLKEDGEVEIEPIKSRSASTSRRSFGGGESARFLRPISMPSSPSMTLNMRKGVDCIRKKKTKPMVIDDENDYGNENRPVGINILKSFKRKV